MVRAYKFLKRSAVSPFSGFRWPAPGVWVDAHKPSEPCLSGIHGCRAGDLAYWLNDELWELELDGALIAGVNAVVASRARLVSRVDAWRNEAGAFVEACIQRAAGRIEAAAPALAERAAGYVEDARTFARASQWPPAAYAAACTAIVAAPERDHAEVLREERAWQGHLLTRLLHLDA